MGVGKGQGKTDDAAGGLSRRDFVFGAVGAGVVVGLGAGVKLLDKAEATTLRPPGAVDVTLDGTQVVSISEERFLSRCVRCMRCYEACPQHVISPATLEQGLLDLRTPSMDFHAGWCNFCEDDNDGVPLCATVCPTGAIEIPEGAKHSDVILGKVLLVKDWCMAYRLTKCRDCYEACEFEAIKLDDVKRPVLVLDKCNGCGKCENACRSMVAGTPVPGATHRAIIVVPATQGKEV